MVSSNMLRSLTSTTPVLGDATKEKKSCWYQAVVGEVSNNATKNYLRVARNILEVSIAIAILFSYFRKLGKPLKIVVFCINAITTL